MAAGAGGSDYLYSVGVDLTKATADLKEWTDKTVPSMMTQPIQLRVGYSAAMTNVNRFVKTATEALKAIPPVNVTFNFSGASRSLNAFMTNFKKNASALNELEGAMGRLEQRGVALGGAFQQFQGGMTGVRQAARDASAGVTAFGEGSSKAIGPVSEIGKAAGTSTKAIDYLGKVMVADVAKILAWGAAFEAMSVIGRTFSNALKIAGETQMEQTLQHLYNGAIDTTQALKNAIVVAEAWGGSIVDVQQVIGLWTKQLGDLNAATLLANKGEEMARASGIATTEVYRDSLAIATQMGLQYKQLPAVYDQITRASLKLGEALRGVNGESSESPEAMKDLFQGLARSAAVLGGSAGFTDLNSKLKGTAAIIAVVANQIQSMGQKGEAAGTNLATMFGSLLQGGPKRGEWETILGVDAFKNADTLLDAMQKHLAQLRQAQVDGLLGVRPQQVETLATMEKSLDHIKELYHDIATSSKGSLDIVATAEMDQFQGQVARLQTSFQALELVIGQDLLPKAQAFVTYLGTYGIPAVEGMVPQILSLAGAVVKLGGAWLIWQAMLKGGSFFASINAQIVASEAALNGEAAALMRARNAGFEDAAAMDTLRSKMTAYQAEAAKTTKENNLLATAYKELGEAAGLTQAQIARLSTAQIEAAENAAKLRAEQSQLAASFKDAAAGMGIEESELLKLATAEERAAVQATALQTASTEAAAAVGGSGAMSLWQRGAAGIGMIATSAAESLGPLAALYAGMAMIQGFHTGATDKYANINSGIENRGLLQTGGVGGLVGSFFTNPLKGVTEGSQVLGALLSGKGWQTQSQNGELVPESINNAILNGQDQGLANSYRHDSTMLARDPHNMDYVRAIEADVKAFGDQQNALKASTDAQKLWNARVKAASQQTAASTAALAKAPGAGDSGHDFYSKPAKTTGGGNPDLTAVNQTASAYDALLKQKQSLIAADEAEIQTNQTLAKLYGPLPQYINAMNAAYKDEEHQYQSIINASSTYISKLKSEISTEQAKLSNSKLSTKQQAADKAALLRAENDLTKAYGTQAEAEAKLQQAEASRLNAMAQLTIKADLQKAGLNDLNVQLRDMASALEAVKNKTGDQLVLAQQDVNLLNQKKAALEALIVKYHGTTSVLDQLKSDLAAVNQALATDSTMVTSDAEKYDQLTESIRKAIDALDKENLGNLGDILGINKQTLTYLTTMQTGIEQIQATQAQINKDRATATGDQLKMLNYEQQELDLKKQLLPLENQILAIRSSPLYQAFNSEIDKMGQGILDQNISKLFGGANATGIMKYVHQFFTGITTDIMNEWWKNMSQSITDKLFNIPSQKQLVDQYQALQTKIQATVNQFNPTGDKLSTALTSSNPHMDKLSASLDRFSGSGGVGTDGSTPGSGGWGVGTDGTDGSSGFAASDQWYGVYDPTDKGQSYESAIQTAANTQQMTQSLTSIDNTLQDSVNSWEQATGGVVSGGGGGGGGGGFFSSLLGLFGMGGGGGGAAGGAGGMLGGLGSMLTTPAGFLTAALGVGSAVGGLLGSNTGAAGDSQHQQYGMFGGLAGGLLGGVGALAGAGLFGVGGLSGLGIAGALSGPFAPLVIGGGILLGSLLGGMFGDHFPISNEPDIGEPNVGGVTYGQFVANMNGAPGSFNGNTIDPFKQFQGQDREAVQLETAVQKVLNDPSSSPQLKAMAKQLQALNPSNEAEGFSILSEYNDVLTLHSGAKVNVESYMGLVQKFMQLAGQKSNQQPAPILSINGMGAGANFYPNMYNTPGLTNQEFTQWQTGSPPGTPPGSYSTPGVGTGSGPSAPPINTNGLRGGLSPTGGANGNVTVQLMIDGKIVAQIVNAYNAQYLLNSGRSIDQVPVLQ